MIYTDEFAARNSIDWLHVNEQVFTMMCVWIVVVDHEGQMQLHYDIAPWSDDCMFCFGWQTN